MFYQYMGANIIIYLANTKFSNKNKQIRSPFWEEMVIDVDLFIIFAPTLSPLWARVYV
jgi:hypothetical protein